MTDRDRPPMTVGDLMTVDLTAVTPRDRFGQARDLMLTSGIHALPVMEGNDVVGIVTATDLLDKWPDNARMSAVMTSVPTLIDVEASLAEAAELLISQRIHHLLVTDKIKVIGILSAFDLLSVLTTPVAAGD